MKPWGICSTLALLLGACSEPGQPAAAPPARRPAAVQSQIDLAGLGKRIWQNECAGSVTGLVSWNAGEAFPSLGIGHFIWYPSGVTGPFDESFPKFVAFARARGVAVPAFFNGAAPWPNKAAFAADRSGKADAMRRWLASHVAVQTDFIIARSRAALPTLLQHSSNPQAVLARYKALAATTQGMYCLVGVSACMSLMFPTIYGIALQGLGDDAKFGAAGLIMAILGGSVLPPVQAAIIDMGECLGMPAVNVSFILPLICFVVVTVYGHRAYRCGWVKFSKTSDKKA